MRTVYGLVRSLLIPSVIFTQEDSSQKDRHIFNLIYSLETTTVENQQRTSTCWAFATTSFIETELIRMGKGKHDISEMFFVRYSYPVKADKYIRYHGKSNFGPGG